MKRLLLLLLVLAGCGAEGPWQAADPRDRIGDQTKPAVWSLVDRPEGAAALLARPGGAPDLVVWCKPGEGNASLRAHVFTPEEGASLSIAGPGGPVILTELRLQGGLRGSQRALIEAGAPLDALAPLIDVRLTYGVQTYVATAADPNSAFARWLAACSPAPG